MKIYIIGLLCAMSQGIQAQKTYTLNDCIDSALVYNRTLQNAALEIESAGHQRTEAYTKYFPQISATITAFHSFDKFIKSDAMGLSELNRGYNASLSVMQPVYAGGQIVTANRLTEVQEDIFKLQRELKGIDIQQKIIENYWQICTLRYNLRTIDAAEKQLDAVMSQVQNFIDAGVTTRNALLQVKLRKHELASNRLKLENAEKTLLMLLAQQVGVTSINGGNHAFDIVLPEEGDAVSMPLMKDVESAVNMRYELALAAKAVDAQRLQVKMEYGKNMPTVAVGVMGMNVGIGGLSDNVKAMTKTNITNGLALATVSVPISAWWGGKHAVKRQELKLREMENDVLDARENLRIDILSAYNSLAEAYQQITIAKASVEESEENLRMHTEQYRIGTMTITDLLDAETLNRKSHDQLSTAIAAYHVALTKYHLKTNTSPGTEG